MFQHGPTQLESVFGRLTVGGPDTCSITNTCEYDQEGRLTKACKAASCATGTPDRVEFTYDGEGHRIEERDYTAGAITTTRTFRYQGDAIVEETTNGTITRSYLVDDAGTILRVCDPDCASPGATSYLPVWNGHGDATALYRINADGTLTLANSYTYSTWGTPTTTTHNGIADVGFRFLYVGAHDVQWDNAYGLGLTYMHARHYSPFAGRFLQPDPAGAEPNLYGYAGNSPASRLDPDGLFQCLLGAVAGPGGIVVACSIEIVVIGAFALLVVHTSTYASRMICGSIGCSLPRITVRSQSGRICVSSGCWSGRRTKACVVVGMAGCRFAGRSYSQDRRLSPGEVQALDRLLRRSGEGGVHELKGGNPSKKDLFKKPNGEIVIKPKNGAGPGEPTGWRVRDLWGGGRGK